MSYPISTSPESSSPLEPSRSTPSTRRQQSDIGRRIDELQDLIESKDSDQSTEMGQRTVREQRNYTQSIQSIIQLFGQLNVNRRFPSRELNRILKAFEDMKGKGLPVDPESLQEARLALSQAKRFVKYSSNRQAERVSKEVFQTEPIKRKADSKTIDTRSPPPKKKAPLSENVSEEHPDEDESLAIKRKSKKKWTLETSAPPEKRVKLSEAAIDEQVQAQPSPMEVEAPSQQRRSALSEADIDQLRSICRSLRQKTGEKTPLPDAPDLLINAIRLSLKQLRKDHPELAEHFKGWGKKFASIPLERKDASLTIRRLREMVDLFPEGLPLEKHHEEIRPPINLLEPFSLKEQAKFQKLFEDMESNPPNISINDRPAIEKYFAEMFDKVMTEIWQARKQAFDGAPPIPQQRAIVSASISQAIAQIGQHKPILPAEVFSLIQKNLATSLVPTAPSYVKQLDATDIGPVSPSLLYHLIGDPIGTEYNKLVGYPLSEASRDITRCLNGIAPFGDEEFATALKKLSTAIDQGRLFLEHLKTASDLSPLSSELKSILSSLPESQSFVLPTGWSEYEGGHAVVVELKKQSQSDLCQVIVYNTGVGIEFHDCRLVEGKFEVAPLILNNVAIDTVCSLPFLYNLKTLECPGHWGEGFFYNGLLGLLQGKVGETPPSYGDVQRSGTCAFASVLNYLQMNTNKHTADRIRVGLGYKAIDRFVRGLTYISTEADISIADRCLHYFAQLVIQAHANGSIPPVELNELQHNLEALQKTLHSLQLLQAQKAQVLTARKPTSSAFGWIPIIGEMFQEALPQLPQNNVVLKTFTYDCPKYCPPYEPTKIPVPPPSLLQRSLQNPREIAAALEAAVGWAESACKDGMAQEALFEIDSFSYQLADACHVQRELFQDAPEEASRLTKACSKLGKIYTQAFLNRCTQMKVPTVVSPLIFATLANFICSVRDAHPSMDEIQMYPLCIGECLPSVVRCEDFQTESTLYKRLRHIGIECDLTKPQEGPRTIIALTSEDKQWFPFLRILDKKYGGSATKLFRDDPTFTEFSNEERSAFLLKTGHRDKAQALLPSDLFYLQDLDNLVYFLSQFDRAESLPHSLENVSWDIEALKGKPVIRKTPPTAFTYFTRSEEYPHAWFRPRPEPCDMEIPDSYATPSLQKLFERPQIALHALRSNTYDIDTALSTFSAHPDYFQSENYRTLFEYILCEPEKISQVLQSPILHSSILNIVPFLEHQLDLAFVNQDAASVLFFSRQLRLFFERIAGHLPEEETAKIQAQISSSFTLVEKFLHSLPEDKQHWHLFAYHSERAHFLNAAHNLSDGQLDQMIASALIAQRTVTSQAPLLEYDTGHLLHTILKKTEVNHRLHNSPDAALNASLPSTLKSSSWKQKQELCFVSDQQHLEYHLSTGTVFHQKNKACLVETPTEFFVHPSVKKAIHEPLPVCMQQDGPGVFSFQGKSTTFRIEQHQSRLFIYKLIGKQWYQLHDTAAGPTQPWYKINDEFESNVIQEHTAWKFENEAGEAILRIENDVGVALFEAISSRSSKEWTVYACDEGTRMNLRLLHPSSLTDNYYNFEEKPFVQTFSSGDRIDLIFFQKLGKNGLCFSFDQSTGKFRRDDRPEEVLLEDPYLPDLPRSRHKLVTQNERTGQKFALIPAHKMKRKISDPLDASKAVITWNVLPYINPFDTEQTSIHRGSEDLLIPVFSYPIREKRLIPNSSEEAAYLAYTYLWEQNYEESARALSQITSLPISKSTIDFLKWLLQETVQDQDPRAYVIRLKAIAILKKQNLLFHIKTDWEKEELLSFKNYGSMKHLCGLVVLTEEEIHALYQSGPQLVSAQRPLVTEPSLTIPFLPSYQRETDVSLLHPDLPLTTFTDVFSVLRGGKKSVQSRWKDIQQFCTDVFHLPLDDYSPEALKDFEMMLRVAAHVPASSEQTGCAILLATFQHPEKFQSLDPSDLSALKTMAGSLLALLPQKIHPPKKEVKIIFSRTEEKVVSKRPSFTALDPGSIPLLPTAITATKKPILSSPSAYASEIVKTIKDAQGYESPIVQQECKEFLSAVTKFQEQSTGDHTFTLDQSFHLESLQKMADETKRTTKNYRHLVKEFLKKPLEGTSETILKTATMAGFTPKLGVDNAVHALLGPFPESFLQLNPALSEQEASELYKATINYLIHKTYQEHIQTTLQKAIKVRQYEPASQEDLQDLYQLVNMKRGYDPITEPALLIFESAFGEFLWPNKVEIVRRFLGGDVEAQGKVIELIMASGKTAVLLPLMAYLVGQQNKLSCIILPEQLFPSMAPLVAEALQKSFSTPVFSWHIQEDQPLTMASLQAIHRGIEATFANHGVIILRPKDYSGLFLQCLFSMMPKGKEAISDERSEREAHQKQAMNEFTALMLQQKYTGESVQPSHPTSREEQELFQSIFGLMVTSGACLFDEVDSIWDVLKEHLLSVSSLVPIDTVTREVLSLLYTTLDDWPSVISTKEAFLSEVTPHLTTIVIDQLAESPQTTIRNAVLDNKKKILEFLQGSGTKESISHLPAIVQDILSVARAQLQDILPQTYTKIYGVNYGEAAQATGQPLTPYAIPYENGIPTHARFGHDLEEVNCTMQMFLHFSSEQLTPYVVDVLKELQFQVRQELVEAPSLSIDKTEVGRWLSSFIGDPQIGTEALCDPENGGKKIVALFKENRAFQISFIDRFIISKIQRPMSYLHTTTQLYSLLASVVRGFSGTTWNKTTYPVPAESSPESVGKTMDILSQEKDPTVLIVANADAIVAANHGIIDIGGLLAEESPKDVAKRILDNCDATAIQGVVFYDVDKKPKVLHRSTVRGKPGKVELYEDKTLPPEQRTAYWSEPFTTGSDLKIQATAECLVSISKDTQLSSVLQGVWRLRRLGRGQHVRFVVNAETKKIMSEALHLSPETELRSDHIIAYTLIKQIERQGSDNCRSLRHRASAVLERGFIQALLVSDPSTLPELYEACSELFVHTPPSRLYDRYATKALSLPVDEAIGSIIAKTLNSQACRYLCERGYLHIEEVKAELEALQSMKSTLPEKVSEVIPETGTKVQVQTQTQTQEKVQTQTQQELCETNLTPSYRYSIVQDFQDKIRPEKFTTAGLFQDLNLIQQNSVSGACIRLRDLFAAEPQIAELQEFFPTHLGTTVNLHQAFQPGFTLLSHKDAYPAEYALSIRKADKERAMVLLSQEDAENLHAAVKDGTVQETPEIVVCLVNIHSGTVYPVVGGEAAASATQNDFDLMVDRLKLKLFDGDLHCTVEEKLALLYIAATLGPDGGKKVLSFVKKFALAIHQEEAGSFGSLEGLFADSGASCVQKSIDSLGTLSEKQRSELFGNQPLNPPYSPKFLRRLCDAYTSHQLLLAF